MKIVYDFSALWSQVRRVSEETVAFEIETFAPQFDPIDVRLAEGIDVQLEDLETSNGLLTYEGRQVLLFIPDQGRGILQAIQDPTAARRFHVADCETLERMRGAKRFDRYVATNRLENRFKIYGTDPESDRKVEADSELMVCKHCLKLLNYHNYRNARSAENKDTWLRFTLAEFFTTYSTNFKELPKQLGQESVGYTSDWAVVSQRVRESAKFVCNECSVDLSGAKNLLHVHHCNGVKSDNSMGNLRPLCIDCHRKQPLHQSMFISASDMALIQRLRREQGIVALDWPSAIRFADLSVRGALQQAQAMGFEPPQLGLEVKGAEGVSVKLPAAWPARRTAICLSEVRIASWQCLSPVEFLRQFS